jgi:hypothetical protein
MKQYSSIRLLRLYLFLTTCLWAATGYTQPPPPPPPRGNDSIAVMPPRCHGDSAHVAIYTRAGGAFLSYHWSNGDTTQFVSLVAGQYYVTVTDSQLAVITDSIKIMDPPPVVIVTDSIRQPSSGSTSNGAIFVHASGGIPGYSYQWSPTSGITDSLTGLSPGIYTVTVNDQNDCTASASFGLYAAGISAWSADIDIKLSPNPASSFISVTCDRPIQELILYNTLGEKIRDYSNLNKLHELIPITELPPGIYTLTVKVGAANITRRILIQR